MFLAVVCLTSSITACNCSLTMRSYFSNRAGCRSYLLYALFSLPSTQSQMSVLPVSVCSTRFFMGRLLEGGYCFLI